MCGQAVCMQGMVRFGVGAFSPFPCVTRSRIAVFTISAPPQDRPRDRPCAEARLVDQLPGYRRPEDGEPPVRSQPALPVQLPIHAGSEEIELREAARAGVANGLGHHLLARRVLVERLVVTDLDEEVPAAVNDGEVGG